MHFLKTFIILDEVQRPGSYSKGYRELACELVGATANNQAVRKPRDQAIIRELQGQGRRRTVCLLTAAGG